MSMRLLIVCFTVLLLSAHSLPAFTASNDVAAPGALFEKLIEESSLSFMTPRGFADITPEDNPVLSYERALRHDSGKVEIRYIIRPLGRLTIDYSDPHNAAPEPNHLFPLLFESLTNELSSGGNTPNKAYPESQARELFNADWAAAAVFDVNPDFSDAYSQALLIAIHKNGQEDAYTVFLYDDYSKTKDIIQDALSTLSFVP